MCESLRKPISRNRWQFNKQINKGNDSRESPFGWNRLHGQSTRVIQKISPGFTLSCNAYTADYCDWYCTPISPTYHLLLHSKRWPPTLSTHIRNCLSSLPLCLLLFLLQMACSLSLPWEKVYSVFQVLFAPFFPWNVFLGIHRASLKELNSIQVVTDLLL